ncbi:MFS transporter [Neisseria leonii]|uniref:MFS transporter n=1 Tax=Neisseria leonii TaxID=2995413 RepID=A0A9X4E239_9NEIS|nr:MFS transporter [Neisseria sp. 51.81]MDD9327764.1 MFS transporter [Neisseria sp. 51.81]
MAKTASPLLPAERRAAVSLSGVYALRMLGMFLVLPVLAVYAASLPGAGSNHALAGLAMGVYGLTQALLQLPLGFASDRFGRKKTIVAGLIVFAAGSFLAAAADSLEMLVAARALQGAGAVSAAVTALLADLTRSEVRTRAMSMIGLSIGLTFSASLVLSPLLSAKIGVGGLFALTGLLTLISIFVVLFYTPNAPARQHEDAQAQPARLGEVFRNRRLMGLNFGIFALHSGMMLLFTTLPFALEQLGMAKSSHWQFYLPATLIGLILMIPAIIVGETRNKLKPVFLTGIALTLAAMLILAFGSGSLWLIASALAVYFTGFNILEASLPSMVSKTAPPTLKGTAMGVYNTLQSAGLFCGGLIGGRLLQHYGFQTAFLAAALLTLIWLLSAARAAAPRPVRNLAFSTGKTWQHRQDELHSALTRLPGVEQVSFSRNGDTVYIQALQQGFDRQAAENIISGA